MLLHPWDFPGKSNGLLFPSPEDLPDPGIKPRPPALQADALPSEPPGKSKRRRKEFVIAHLILSGSQSDLIDLGATIPVIQWKYSLVREEKYI